MNEKELEMIIACLPKGRTFFHYFPGRYALMLLEWHVKWGRPIHEVRRSPFARLLKTKAVAPVLSQCGGGLLSRSALQSVWPEWGECYLLSVAKWGSQRRSWQWKQNTRRGFNLVLQLNFSMKHNRSYFELLKPEMDPTSCGHPNASRRKTLAWARIDVEPADGEALIEEIQTDWIKYSRETEAFVRSSRNAEEARRRLSWEFGDESSDPKRFRHYMQDVLRPHVKMWSEAMLSAALWFIREEMGICRIFYHTFETGRWLKGIDWTPPPRSLYTDLPSRFCFQETANPPSFVMNRRRWSYEELEKLRFYVLEL